MYNRFSDRNPVPYSYEDERTYLLELREQCDALEAQLLTETEVLPEHVQMLLQSYISVREELTVKTVQATLRFVKK